MAGCPPRQAWQGGPQAKPKRHLVRVRARVRVRVRASVRVRVRARARVGFRARVGVRVRVTLQLVHDALGEPLRQLRAPQQRAHLRRVERAWLGVGLG